MGPKWRRGEVPGRRGRRESLVARGSSRGDEVGLCRIGSLVEMGKTSGRRFVCRRRAWTGTGSRGRQLDSGHGHGWRVGDEQRGARKENNPRSDSRGAMCVWCRHQGPDNRRGGMGFGASGPAECCCRAGKRRGLTESRTTIQSRNQSCCPLFSLFLSRCPRGRLPGLGAGRGNLQGRGWFETRPHAGVGRRAHSGPVQVWMQRSVALAGTGPNGKRARRDVGGQKYLHRDPRKADLQMAMAAYGNGQWARKWQWQTSRGGGTASGLGRHLQRAGPR